MERSKFARSVDNLSLTLAFFLLFFLLTKTFISKTIIALIVSTIIVGILMFIVISFQSRKFEKLSIEKSELGKVEDYNFELRKMDKQDQYKFFEKMFSSENVNLEKNCMIINDSICFLVNLENSELSDSEVYNAYALLKKTKTDEAVIICNQVSQNALKVSQKLDKKIYFFSPLETYALMKKFNYFVAENKENTIKPKRKINFSYAFARKKARTFLRIGALLYFLALFIPFSKYYIISGSVCLAISVICFLFGQKDVVKSETSILLK